MQNRKDKWQYLMVAVLMMVLALATVGIPGVVQAANFGGITDNGTAAYMGIGTATPERPLHVFGNLVLIERNADAAAFILQRTPSVRFQFGVSDTDKNGHGFSIYTYPLGGAATPRLFMDTSGRVGINTITPGAGYKLHVVNDNASQYAGAIFGTTNSGAETVGVAGVHADGKNTGALGGYSWGVYGMNNNGNEGSLGTADCGVYGKGTGTGDGVYGQSTGGYAGYFLGKAIVTDNLSVGTTSTLASTLNVAGSLAIGYSSISSPSYTASKSDCIMGVSAPGGGTTIYLPAAGGVSGRLYTIKNLNGNAISIDPNGTESIDGSSSNYSLNTQWKYVTLVSNGSNWLIVANN